VVATRKKKSKRRTREQLGFPGHEELRAGQVAASHLLYSREIGSASANQGAYVGMRPLALLREHNDVDVMPELGLVDGTQAKNVA